MSETSEILSPEQNFLRIRELDSVLDGLLKQQAVFKERQAVAHRDIQVLLQEMAQAGTSPQTIQADLTAAREKLTKDTCEYEARLVQAKQQLDVAEQSLNQLDSQKQGK